MSLKCITEFRKTEFCLKGTKITLLKMYMDMTEWLYIYEEATPFTLPTTCETYGNMDIAMDIMTGFKV